MMSNCGFWSASGELLAVHGPGPSAPDPLESFPSWAAKWRLPPGRLVRLSNSVGVSAPVVGWTALGASARPAKGPGRPCTLGVPVAVAAPALDSVAELLFPLHYSHAQFSWHAWPTWCSSCQPEASEGPGGWYAALAADRSSQFLVRLVPHQGRLPGEGWRNMLAWTVKAVLGFRLVPLNSLPSPEALAQSPSWDYRVEAGHGVDAAAWDVQVLPSRRLLAQWAPGISDPWEATALLRWVRPGTTPPPLPAGPLGWADLFGRLSATDARLLVQNVLTTGAGGAQASAVLFYDSVVLPARPDGRSLVRHVPQPGLPLSLLSVLFGKRAWREVDRARRSLPPQDERPALRAAALADLDRRLAEQRLTWSNEALELWQKGYREPVQKALAAELAAYRSSDRWSQLVSGDPRVAEQLLRRLDVTDLALCLRDAPDRRWRQFITARREAEIREEQEFCRLWAARGELTLDRELDAWRSWDALATELPLTDGAR